MLKFDSRLTSKRFTEEVIIFLRTETKIKPPMQESYLIPVRNGIFNLHTKQLEPFSPKHVITTKITTTYNPEAKNILRLVVRKFPTGESTHYFFFMIK
ncbi:hypothetical protein HCC41_07505 [Streptococcus suis]|nr:hypothetical protein [Streptococcus suis]